MRFHNILHIISFTLFILNKETTTIFKEVPQLTQPNPTPAPTIPATQAKQLADEVEAEAEDVPSPQFVQEVAAAPLQVFTLFFHILYIYL